MSRVIACIATLPRRVDTLAQTIASLKPQVDEIRVYLNGHTEVPECCADVLVGTGGPDLGDARKFHWCGTEQDVYWMTCDDDIIYPANYAERMVGGVDRYHRTAIVGVHGIWFRKLHNFTSYYRCRQVWNTVLALAADRHMHALGTGTTCWHSSTINVTIADFPIPNMGDVWLAIAAKAAGVSMIALQRRAGWLVALPVPPPTIYRTMRNNDHDVTQAVRDAMPWPDL